MTLYEMTTELCTHILTGNPQLKAAYPRVTMGDRGGKRWPVYWGASSNEGQPLLNDSLRDYVYIRQTGPESSRENDLYTSNQKSLLVSYPCRMVVHMRNPSGGGDRSRDYLDAYRSLLLGFRFSDGFHWSDINSADFDFKRVYAYETENADNRQDTTGMLLSIDFNLVGIQTATDCVPEIFECASL